MSSALALPRWLLSSIRCQKHGTRGVVSLAGAAGMQARLAARGRPAACAPAARLAGAGCLSIDAMATHLTQPTPVPSAPVSTDHKTNRSRTEDAAFGNQTFVSFSFLSLRSVPT